MASNDMKGIFVTAKGKKKSYDTLEKTITVLPNVSKKKKPSMGLSALDDGVYVDKKDKKELLSSL